MKLIGLVAPIGKSAKFLIFDNLGVVLLFILVLNTIKYVIWRFKNVGLTTNHFIQEFKTLQKCY